MKNKKNYIIAALAALTFAGCGGNDNPEEGEEKSRVQTEWDARSDQERKEGCEWYELMGEGYTRETLIEEGGDENEVAELIDIMNAEC